MVEIMVFLTEVFLLTLESSWIIKNFIFCLDKHLLTFLLYSLGIDSKIHSIMKGKKIEKIATVSFAKSDQNEPGFYLSFLFSHYNLTIKKNF